MWLYLFGFLCIIRGFLTSETQSNDARHNPKSHICVSKILECDLYRVQLSPGKEIGAPMFTELNDLRKACKYANRFLLCLKIASDYCKRFPFLLGNEMILSRSFPQELCQFNSFWETWYIKTSSCVNKFSDSIEDICAMNVIQDLITRYEDHVEMNCRFQIKLRKCRIEAAKGRCGTAAAEILRRLLLYQYEYDFMCSLVEEKNEVKSSPAVPFTTTDSSEIANKPSEKANNRRENFHTRENAKMAKYPEERVLEIFSNEIDDLSLDFENKNNLLTAEKVIDVSANFKTDTSSNVVGIPNGAEMEYFSEPNGDSFENEAKPTTSGLGFCFLQKSSASLDSQQTHCYSVSSGTKTFGLYEIWVDCVKYLGCGAATILWAKDSLLKNVFCSWSSAEVSEKLFKCSIHIDEACSFEENSLQKNTGDTIDLAANHRTLHVYLYENEHYAEIATMKVNYFKPNKNSLPESTYVDYNSRSKHTNFQRVARRVGSFDSTKNSNEHLDAVSRQKERVVSIDSECLRDLWYYLQQSTEKIAYEQFEELVTDFSTELSTMEMNTIDLVRAYLLSLAPSRPPPPRSLYQPYVLFRPHEKSPSDTETETLRPGLERYVLGQLDSDRDKPQKEIFKLNDGKFSAVLNGYYSTKTPCPTTESIDKFDIRPGKLIDFAHIKKAKKLRQRYALGRLGNDQDGNEGEIFELKDETFSHAHNEYRSKEIPCSTISSPDKFDIKPGMLINFEHIKEKEREFYEDSTPSLHTSKIKYTLERKQIDHYEKKN